MSDYRDRSWEFSSFVRSFARYLDQRVGFRMRERRKRKEKKKKNGPTPAREISTKMILNRSEQQLEMLERLIDCKPMGLAKGDPLVAIAMYPLMKEDRHIYSNLKEMMAILVERFMKMEISYCIKVHDLFTSLSKKFKEFTTLHDWCNTVGIGKPSSDYPTIVEDIT